MVKVSFNQTTLDGYAGAAAALQWGPDGKLYVAERFGEVKVLTVAKSGDGYKVTDAETIELIKQAPNHNDDGKKVWANFFTGETNDASENQRQITGIVVGGTADDPLVYVSHSDPRHGGGSGGADKNLDTNSGVISRLTMNDAGKWQKMDIVRGLPRSEENHATNGLELSADGKTLYAASGGHTNAGAPSNNFAGQPEYAYAAAILEIDLAAIDKMPVKDKGSAHPYLYDLPTLDDPDRPNNGKAGNEYADGSDVSGPWGGNDGFNMAKIVADSPVQIYSPGYRNSYDVLLTEDGKMWTYDNGANVGWGGHPVDENGKLVTSIKQNATNKVGEGGTVKNYDHLHLIEEKGYYGGHPNPIRAEGAGAGLLYAPNKGTNGATFLPEGSPGLPADFDTVIPKGAENPIEGVYKEGGFDDGALDTGKGSVNGLAEYISGSTFGGDIEGALLATDYNGDLYIIPRNASGIVETNTAGNGLITAKGKQIIDLSVSGPLGIDAVGEGHAYDGTIWIAGLGSGQIAVLAPGKASGPDNDLDDDGLNNTVDPFALDADNGTKGADIVSGGEKVFYDFESGSKVGTFGGSGWTGAMINGTDAFADDELYEEDNIIAGGAGGQVQFKSVQSGDAHGNTNTQKDALQFGLTLDDTVKDAAITLTMTNWIPGAKSTGGYPSAGLQIGTGHQDDYIKLVIGARGIKNGGYNKAIVETVMESGGKPTSNEVTQNALLNGDVGWVQLRLTVNPDAGTVTPSWRFGTGAPPSSDDATKPFVEGTAVTVPAGSDLMKAITGDHAVGGQDSGLAVGLIATSNGGSPFTANFDDILIDATKKGGSADLKGPTVQSIKVVGPSAGDADASVTVVYTDPSGIDTASLGGNDLKVIGPAPVGGIQLDGVNLSNGGKTATVSYVVKDPTNGWVDGAYKLKVKGGQIADASPAGNTNTGAAKNFQVQTTSGDDVVAAINAGGAALTQDGIAFSADKHFLNGDTYKDNAAGNGVQSGFNGTVYKTERYGGELGAGQLKYAVPVSAGNYQVELYFAEIFLPSGGGNGVGERVFNVKIEDQLVLEDFDILKATGGDFNKPVVIDVPGTFSPGEAGAKGALDIAFNASADNAKISGIVIREAGDKPANSAPTFDPIPDQAVAMGDEVNVGMQAHDADDDPLSMTVKIVDSKGKVVPAANYTFADGSDGYGQLTWLVPDDLTAHESYKVTVTATDGINAPVTSNFSIDVTAGDGTPGAYRPNANGHFVIEAEAAPKDGVGGWQHLSAGDLPGGHQPPSGDGFVRSTTDAFAKPSGSTLAYQFVPEADGFVRVNLIASRSDDDPDVSNSSWVGVSLDGVPLTALPYKGAPLDSSQGHYEVSSTGGKQSKFILADKNVGNTAKPIVMAVEAGETYDLFLSERSEGHEVDKIVLEFSDTKPDGFGNLGALKQEPPSPQNAAPQNGDPIGAAELSITKGSNNVQISNYNNNSFQIKNVGDKDIASILIDVTDALYPDTVFDPFGLAGDTIAKGLEIDDDGNTGVKTPNNGSYVGAGGKKGYEKVKLDFNGNVKGGFDPGETVKFSVDMDPNSVAGASKNKLDAGSEPSWDVGGVSGAELIGSAFTVTFTDGSKAKGQLQGVGNQGGAQTIATQEGGAQDVSLQVNGLGSGGVGTYDDGGPNVVIKGPAGATARVVLTKGFIQPVTNEFFNGNASQKKFAPQLQARLDALAEADFPANNAVEFQTVDIKLNGNLQNISNRFDFSGVAKYNFQGEDEVPLGFVASVIDPSDKDLPAGPVTEPIYLTYDEDGGGGGGGTGGGSGAVKLFSGPSLNNELGAFSSVAAALNAASKGDAVVVEKPGQVGNVGALAVNDDDLTIIGDAPFDAKLTLNGANDLSLGGNAELAVVGNGKSNEIDGNDGANIIKGGGGSDDLGGAKGNDTIDGGPGDDIIRGGKGNDVIAGAGGNDALFGGQGNDEMDGGNGADALYGRSGNDWVNGGGGNDRASGHDGDDMVIGQAGNDTLSGDDGDDIVKGGGGADILDGGAGKDKLIGGGGADIFVLAFDEIDFDRISDFKSSQNDEVRILFDGAAGNSAEIDVIKPGKAFEITYGTDSARIVGTGLSVDDFDFFFG